MHSIHTLAQNERQAGQALSCIGYPSADGSGGSVIQPSRMVSITKQSACPDGAWAFIRYFVTAFGDSLPLYKPLLDAQIQAALEGEDAAGQLTEQDVEKLYALMDATLVVDTGDYKILQIIEEEASAFFAGTRDAEGTAGLIQQRVSLYLAEQS